jgi:hypothetical protein
MKIASARISPVDMKNFKFQAHVVATFEDGTERIVVEYYPDEIQFSPEEVIGKTESEVRQMKLRKDREYLLSP